jgi:hypothetical protein
MIFNDTSDAISSRNEELITIKLLEMILYLAWFVAKIANSSSDTVFQEHY